MEEEEKNKGGDPLEAVRKAISDALAKGVKGEDIEDALKQMLHSDDEEHEEDKDASREEIAHAMGFPGFAN
jgi:TPP-dependent pyruvate/acetoin dehydrogenase alpha subunit